MTGCRECRLPGLPPVASLETDADGARVVTDMMSRMLAGRKRLLEQARSSR